MDPLPPHAGPDPHFQRLEELLRNHPDAWELFRWGYETGLAQSIDHERLARIIRAQEFQQKEIKSLVKSTAGFTDVLAHRERSRPANNPLRRSA